MAFRDLDEFQHRDEPIVLPIRGVEYVFPSSISARTWLKVQRVGGKLSGGAAPDEVAVSDAEADELRAELCGDTLEEMLADGVTSRELQIVLTTLMAFHLSDPASARKNAEAVWEAQGEPQAPNREARRAKKPAAKSTPSRGSHAGSSAAKKRAERASPGSTSSSTGS
jgi:hypothetical protein